MDVDDITVNQMILELLQGLLRLHVNAQVQLAALRNAMRASGISEADLRQHEAAARAEWQPQIDGLAPPTDGSSSSVREQLTALLRAFEGPPQ